MSPHPIFMATFAPSSKPFGMSTPYLVEMIERLPVLCDLLLGEALGVSDEDLVLGLVEGPVDGCYQLAPASSKTLHGVLTVGVVKDESCLNFLEEEDGERGGDLEKRRRNNNNKKIVHQQLAKQ